MTPPAAHGWSPADYYRASRAARRACEARAAQLQIVGVLDSGEVARAESVSAAASPVSSAPLVPHSPPNQDALDPNTRAPVAGLPQDLRDRSQKGA